MSFQQGLAIDPASGRVAFSNDDETLNYSFQRPINDTTNRSIGILNGSLVNVIAGLSQGINDAGRQIYIDIQGGEVPTPNFVNNGLLYNEMGALICDSVGTIFSTSTQGVPITSANAVCINQVGWVIESSGTIADTGTLVRMGGGVSNGSSSFIMCGVTNANVLNFYTQNKQTESIDFPLLTVGPTILPNTLATVSQTGYGVLVVYAKADGLYANNLRIVGNDLSQSEQKISSLIPAAGSQISLTGQTQTNYWYGFVSATLTGATGVTTLIPFWANLGSVQAGGTPITIANGGSYALSSCPINGEGNMMFVGSNDTTIYRLAYNTTSKTVALQESYLNGALFSSNFKILQLTNIGGSKNYVAALMSDSTTSNAYNLGVFYFDTSASKAPYLKVSQVPEYVGDGNALVAFVIGNRVNNNVAVLLAYKNTNGSIVGYQFTDGALKQLVVSKFADSPVATGYAFWSDSNAGAPFDGDLIIEYQLASGGLPGTYALSVGTQLL